MKLSSTQKLAIFMSIALVGFGLLIYYQQETFRDTWETLLDAKLGYVLLLPLIQVLNYFFIGTYYRKMFGLFDAKISVARSWGVVAAMNFVNQVLPSGGLSGITYLAYGFRSKIATGKTTLIQVGRYMFAFGAYTVLAPLALLLLIQGGRSDQLDELYRTVNSNWAALVVVLVFVLMMASVVAAFLSPKVSHKSGRGSLRVINWINKNILRRSKPVKLDFLKNANKELQQGISLVKEKGMRATYPGFFMLLSAATEVLIVYVSLLAVGGDVGLGPVFLAFVAANIVGVVSVIPGDVGVHEATVILVLVAFGVDEPVAISTTLLYRVFNKVIFLPIGFFFYARILKPAIEAKKAKASE